MVSEKCSEIGKPVKFRVLILVLLEFLRKPNAVELARIAEAQPKMGVAKMVSEDAWQAFNDYHSQYVLILVLVEDGLGV